MFKKATKSQAKLRLALGGPAGSGKTWTALEIASHLIPNPKIALIDTEYGSASLYADKFNFDVVELSNYAAEKYIEAIDAAEQAGYDILIIDSLSHAWNGEGGVLDKVTKASINDPKSNSFQQWGKVGTPAQNKLIQRILKSKMHVIATMRSKMEYVIEQNERGRNVPVKVGLAPVQRDDVEYEFGVFMMMNNANTATVVKTRCSELNEAVIEKPGKQLAQVLAKWLSDGAAQFDMAVLEARFVHAFPGGEFNPNDYSGMSLDDAMQLAMSRRTEISGTHISAKISQKTGKPYYAISTPLLDVLTPDVNVFWDQDEVTKLTPDDPNSYISGDYWVTYSTIEGRHIASNVKPSDLEVPPAGFDFDKHLTGS